MQTPQTNQTIKQFTPKTIFLIFVKSRLLQYNTQQGISSRDPGRFVGEGKGERGEPTIFNTTNKGLCSMSNIKLRRDSFRREVATSKNEAIGRSRGIRIVQSDYQGKHSHSYSEDTRQDEWTQRTTKMLSEVREAKGTTRIPNLRSESRQYAASKTL